MTVYSSVPWAPSYSISDDGRIFRSEKKIKQRTNGRAYWRVTLSENGKRMDAYVHRLVCEAFHGPPPQDHECRHFDGDRANNHERNLSWATKAENEADKLRHGTLVRGDAQVTRVLSEALVMAARNRAVRGERIVDIADALGFDSAAIRAAIRGDNWRHLPGSVSKPEKRSRDKAGRYL